MNAPAALGDILDRITILQIKTIKIFEIISNKNFKQKLNKNKKWECFNQEHEIEILA